MQDELQAHTFLTHVGLIIFARWRLWLTVDADAKSLVSVGEDARRAGLRWALSCIYVYQINNKHMELT